MATAFTISRETGSIRIGDGALLTPGQDRATLNAGVTDPLARSRNHGNGYEWLDLDELTFGGQSATLSLGFRDGRFEQASWSVELPNAPMEGGWPTRAAIDAKIAFVRAALAEMGIRPGRMAWGEVSSSFDEKGFSASNGLRYSLR